MGYVIENKFVVLHELKIRFFLWIICKAGIKFIIKTGEGTKV